MKFQTALDSSWNAHESIHISDMPVLYVFSSKIDEPRNYHLRFGHSRDGVILPS